MKRFAPDDAYLGALCLELSLLVSAGTAFADGFLMLRDDDADPSSAALMGELSSLCESGLSLSAALAQTGAFPAHLTGALAVAEKTGRLEASLQALARHYESRASLKKSLKSAVAYPAFLALLILAVVLSLLFYVFPVFEGVIDSLGTALPPLGAWLMGLSRHAGGFLVFLAALFALLLVFALMLRMFPRLKERAASFARGLFEHTKTASALERARFHGALSMALASGMTAGDALGLTRAMFQAGHRGTLRKIDAAARLLEELPLSDALYEAGLFTARQKRTVALALKAGGLDAVLEAIAARGALEAEERLLELASRVEPALVLLACALVGILLLAVMLPLSGVMSALSRP